VTPMEIVTPEPDQWHEMVAVDARNFGLPADTFADPGTRDTMDLTRFRVAVDDGRMVAMAGSVPVELTLPGGALVPMTGVTWVSVVPSHRRRGLLARLLGEVHAVGRERGEPVQGLFASEAGIYARQGYGEATERWTVELDAAEVRHHVRGFVNDATLPVTEVIDVAAGDDMRALFDDARRGRPGEIGRSDAQWRAITSRWGSAKGDALPVQMVTCDGGWAAYRITPRWDVVERGGRPSHVMTIIDMVALTADASRSLWNRLVRTDLVATIQTNVLAPDDPLPLLLSDRRWLRTTALHDGLWLRVADPLTAFTARTYGGHDRLVLSIDERALAIDGSPEGARCAWVDEAPDMVVEAGALGALLVGPRSLHRLVAAGRVTPVVPGALERAARFFAAERPAHCSTIF
jgi:predicted acetyltransferase